MQACCCFVDILTEVQPHLYVHIRAPLKLYWLFSYFLVCDFRKYIKSKVKHLCLCFFILDIDVLGLKKSSRRHQDFVVELVDMTYI